jgi:hypothetical protein
VNGIGSFQLFNPLRALQIGIAKGISNPEWKWALHAPRVGAATLYTGMSNALSQADGGSNQPSAYDLSDIRIEGLNGMGYKL